MIEFDLQKVEFDAQKIEFDLHKFEHIKAVYMDVNYNQSIQHRKHFQFGKH